MSRLLSKHTAPSLKNHRLLCTPGDLLMLFPFSFAKYLFFESPEKPHHASVKTFCDMWAFLRNCTCFHWTYFQFAVSICAIWKIMETASDYFNKNGSLFHLTCSVVCIEFYSLFVLIHLVKCCLSMLCKWGLCNFVLTVNTS